MSEQKNTKDIYKAFGRHTAVGQMMYKLYNAAEEKNKYQPNVDLNSNLDITMGD